MHCKPGAFLKSFALIFFASVASVIISEATADGGTFGNSPAPSICARYTNREVLRKFSRDANHRFSFRNTGGLFNGGVCWWHSRFQRSVWSLADFRPDLPKPSIKDAEKIISGFAHFKGVQVVPGYADFATFSRDFRPQIQSELNAWQLRDGILNQSWLRGLSGRADLGRHPDRMVKIMDDLWIYYYQSAVENFFPWVMLQLTGIDSHASLVVGMVKKRDGYQIEVVDSNYPGITTTWGYRYGDGQLEDSKYDTVPYRGLNRDITAMQKILKNHCTPSTPKASTWPSSSASEEETAQDAADDLEPYLGNEAAFQP